MSPSDSSSCRVGGGEAYENLDRLGRPEPSQMKYDRVNNFLKKLYSCSGSPCVNTERGQTLSSINIYKKDERFYLLAWGQREHQHNK